MDLTLLEQTLRAHRTVQIVGDSGAGLTTRATQIHREWPGAAVVQQDATAHVSYLRDTVIEEVALGLEQRGRPIPEMRTRCRDILTAAGLTDLAEHNPAHLSGGQTRRLAIATVAVLQPDVLLLDDPFAGLDPTSCTHITKLLDALPSKVVVLGTRTRSIDSVVLTLSGGHLHPGAPTPHPVELPDRVTPTGTPIGLGDVSATRGLSLIHI